MKSITTSRFWQLYNTLPEGVQRQADRAYQLWQINPHAHGLYFKRVAKRQPIYSIRVGRGYRALGILQGEAIRWFWIGSHDEYVRMLRSL